MAAAATPRTYSGHLQERASHDRPCAPLTSIQL
jgi:hypothetical protein